MAGAILKIILISVFFAVSYQQQYGGEFYTIIKGFFPRTNANEYMSYRLEVVPNPKDPQEKTICGFVNMKAPIVSLGFIGNIYKKSGTQWLKQGNTMTQENICKTTRNFGKFEECFSGKIKKSDCSLNAGNHTIKYYNIGDDIRDAVKLVPFGEYKIDIIVTGIMDGKLVKMPEIQYMMEIANSKLKTQAPPSGGSEKKRNGKGKSG